MGSITFSAPWLLSAAVLPVILSASHVFRRTRPPSVGCPAVAWLPGRGGQGTAAAVLVPQLRYLAMFALVPLLAGMEVAGPRSAPAAPVGVALVVDTSSSMTAEDFRPAGRLEAAKDKLADFVRSNPKLEIGLVTFSGTSRLVAPITADHGALLQAMSRISPATYGEDGTAIGSGLGSALNRLRGGPWAARRIVLITDGVSNRGAVAPGDAAEMARILGVVIDAVGMGTDAPTRLRVPGAEGEQLQLQARIDIDDEALDRISQRTGGEYRRVRSSEELGRALEAVAARTAAPEASIQPGPDAFWPRLLALTAAGLLLLEYALQRFVLTELPGG